MRYLARSKFSRSLVHKKNFSFIWQVVFKLGYVCQESWDTSSEFEWTLRKVASENNSPQISKQGLIKLSLAYSFRKIFFIGQNLNDVHITYSFLELLIFFWFNSSRYWLFGVFFSSHHRNTVSEYNSKGNQSWNKNKHLNLFLS